MLHLSIHAKGRSVAGFACACLQQFICSNHRHEHTHSKSQHCTSRQALLRVGMITIDIIPAWRIQPCARHECQLAAPLLPIHVCSANAPALRPSPCCDVCSTRTARARGRVARGALAHSAATTTPPTPAPPPAKARAPRTAQRGAASAGLQERPGRARQPSQRRTRRG